MNCDCSDCSARYLCGGCNPHCRFRHCDGHCDHCAAICGRRHDLSTRLQEVNGLELDMPLSPQPQGIPLPHFIPQLIAPPDMPVMLDRESIIGIGISLVFTPKGFISNRVGGEDGHGVRWEWWLSERPRLLLLGNTQDPLLESLWAVMPEMRLFGTARTINFDLATSLNFSLYVERPRLEHLYNVKRTWLTISQLQRETPNLVPIPHLQWFREDELKRQISLLKEEGFHTITINLQTVREKWIWQRILRGLETVKDQYPEVRPIFTGVSSLKTMARLRQIFPWCCFCNSVCQYLAQRHIRLRREGMRLVRETVTGNPSVVMSHSIAVYKQFLQELSRSAR